MMTDRILRDRYRLVQKLGEGTFGNTYLAQDLNWPEPRSLAVKHLRPKFERQGQEINPADLLIAKEYFDREAAKLAKLDHCDQIPRLIERFEEGGEFFIVMDYVEGRPLSFELTPGAPWSETAVVELIRGLLEPLAVVHSNQLIHRDVKPANVMRRRRDDRLVLIDFGGVKEVATAQYSQARLVPTPPTFWIGTPGYLAPEQALGAAQYQSDLYSVGVIGLQALLGRGPGQIPGNLARGVFDWEQIQRLMPMGDRLRQLLQKLTNHDWQQRYPDGQAALEAIESLFFSSAAPTVRIGSPPPPLPIVPPREGLRTRLGRWLFGSQDATEGLPETVVELPPAPARPNPSPPRREVFLPKTVPDPPRRARREVDPFAGWNLQEWSFETVRVDRAGRIVKRSKKTAKSHFVDLGGGVKLEMVAIPGGTFQMGSLKHDSEKPVHPVTVPPLLVSRYPVTVEQWRRVAGSFPAVLNPQLKADPSRWKDAKGPVEQVNWFDAMEFCARLSKATNRLYRLPTEAEWEYACRGGTQTPFAFGETLTPELANYDGNSTYADGPKGEYRKRTTPVSQFPPNRFGLQDMHGNLLEWCMDDWYGSYANAPSTSEARFQNDNHSHVFNSAIELNNYQEQFFQKMVKVDNEQLKLLRGGSWICNPRYCRSAFRSWWGADFIFPYIGFRVFVWP